MCEKQERCSSQACCNPGTTLLIDLVTFERLLIPMLNEVRKAQGKRPVIIPKG
jgi:hypothetical protein